MLNYSRHDSAINGRQIAIEAKCRECLRGLAILSIPQIWHLLPLPPLPPPTQPRQYQRVELEQCQRYARFYIGPTDKCINEPLVIRQGSKANHIRRRHHVDNRVEVLNLMGKKSKRDHDGE